MSETQPQVEVPANRAGDRAAFGHQVGSGAASSWMCDTAMLLRYRAAGVDYADSVPASTSEPVYALVWQTTEADTVAADKTLYDTVGARWKVFSVQQRATLPAVGTARLYVIQEARWSDLAGTLDVLPIEYLAAPNTWRPAEVLNTCVPFRSGRQVLTLLADDSRLAGCTALTYKDGVIYWGQPGAVFQIDSSVTQIAGTGVLGLDNPPPVGDALTTTITTPNQLFIGPDGLLHIAESNELAEGKPVDGTFRLPVTTPPVPGHASAILYPTRPGYLLIDGHRVYDPIAHTLSTDTRTFDIPGWVVPGQFRIVESLGVVVADDGTIYLSQYQSILGDNSPGGPTQGAHFNLILRVPTSGPITVVRGWTYTDFPNTVITDIGGPYRSGSGGIVLTPDHTGILYVNTNTDNLSVIERLDLVTGAITLYAGTVTPPTSGNGNGGPLADAYFGFIASIYGNDKVLYINTGFGPYGGVRRITYATGVIDTAWRNPGFSFESAGDGKLVEGAATPFQAASCADPCGNIYVAVNHALYKAGCRGTCPGSHVHAV